MIRQGIEDAIDTLVEDVKESKGTEEATKQFGMFMNVLENQNGEENRILKEVAENIKIK